VARISVATGIAPNELLATPPRVFWTMVKVLEEQQREYERVRGQA
jgi:hypothetical protein